MTTVTEVDPALAGRTLADLLVAGPTVQVAALEHLVGALTEESVATGAGVTPGDHVRPTPVAPGAAAMSRESATPPEDPALLGDLAVRVARVGARLQAGRLGWLSAIEADGRWALDAPRTFAHWVAWTHGSSLSTARREVRLARTLRDHLPGTAAAARAGRIGPDHVWALASIAATSESRCAALAAPAELTDAAERTDAGERTDQTERTDLTERTDAAARTGEDVLVDLATRHRVEPFRTVLRHFSALADPEAADRAFADAAEREFVDLAPTMGGFHLAGFLTTEHGQALRAALDAATGVPAADDVRTPRQRRAQGLADLARTALDHGTVGHGAAVRPHLSVLVSWTEFSTLLARTGADRDPVTDVPVPWDRLLAEPPARWADGTGPVPPAVLKRLACDATVTRLVFGPDSQILNVGRRERTFTGARRAAVIARDGGCVWRGCDAPPSRCEVHHALTPWARGGETSTDNAALLCWFHHDHVDTHQIGMEHTSGRWRFRRRDGTLLDDG